nr:coniferyl aldehyde dehydrogenase [uncultured Pseudomonas sp.]
MNSPLALPDNAAIQIERMTDLLASQKKAHSSNPMPTASERILRLGSLREMLLKHQEAICEAISEDFGNRSLYESKIGELATCLAQIDYYSRHVSDWMHPSRRHVDLIHQPAKAWVQYQPLGVIGIISPWNYPLFLSIGPLICALASGNHAMIKMSDASPRLGSLLDRILTDYFPNSLVAIVNHDGCGIAISEAFCRLNFDQITFTGSPAVGKIVMKAAAENLVPVLLELGGKCPVIAHPSASLKEVAERLTFGKLWNAGQTCVAPDYIFLPRGKTDDFVQEMTRFVGKFYPTLQTNTDYTSIINERQYLRLRSLLEDAKSKGAEIFEINPSNEDLSKTRKIAPTIITNVSDDMAVAHEELFGPILLIHEYDNIQEAIEYINTRPRPLALYYFDHKMSRANEVARQTHSGHFGINAVLTHFAQDDLPVGGVGNSGMGKYHGFEGFATMSNARSIMYKPRFYALRTILPPFGRVSHKLALWLMMR